MGERKGTNKYYPPDYDPKQGGLNKFMGTHALRERARKLHLGIMIIRFEMPYNIWCEGCNNHIGMGVRYNAEKKKIGMYYSTPVYQFRMKCHLCDNHFEIKTDPGNLDYVIVSGARRQERRWDPTENGQVVPDDKQVIHKLADDAMFKLEHVVEDQKKMKDVTPTISKLENLQERWKDDYMANKSLRDIFRVRKRELQDKQAKDNEFLKKRSLDIPLLQESDDDAKIASLIRLQPAKSVEERLLEKRSEIDKSSQFPFPLFPASETATSSSTSSNSSEPGNLQPSPSFTNTKVTDSQFILEQRRLSLGIKLKKDLVQCPKSPAVGTSRSEPGLKNTKIPRLDSDTSDSDDQVDRLTNKVTSRIEIESRPRQENDLLSGATECSTDSGVTCDDSGKSRPISGLSSLVSYSDDDSSDKSSP